MIAAGGGIVTIIGGAAASSSVVERTTFLGLSPTAAVIIAMALLAVVVLAIVAMTRVPETPYPPRRTCHGCGHAPHPARRCTVEFPAFGPGPGGGTRKRRAPLTCPCADPGDR